MYTEMYSTCLYIFMMKCVKDLSYKKKKNQNRRFLAHALFTTKIHNFFEAHILTYFIMNI